MEVVNTEPLSLTGFLTIINSSIFEGFRTNTGTQNAKSPIILFLGRRMTELSKPKPTQF
jgi:hypothetical protein